MEASPQRPRRRWSAEAKSRLIEATLKPGANVSAIARQAGMAPAQLFGWRGKAIKSGAVTPQRDADRLGFVDVTQAHSGRRRRRPGSFGQDYPGGSPGMIPAGVKVLIASHPVDFRKGPDGLLALVRDAGSDPFNGRFMSSAPKEWTGSRSSGGTAAACVFMPSDWTTRSSAGRGSATTGSSSIMLSSWLWLTEWTGNGFERRPSGGRNRLGKTLLHDESVS
ncbi:transposase [Mesorhizobium sp. M0254]